MASSFVIGRGRVQRALRRRLLFVEVVVTVRGGSCLRVFSDAGALGGGGGFTSVLVHTGCRLTSNVHARTVCMLAEVA
jgi:hypothetical protein